MFGALDGTHLICIPRRVADISLPHTCAHAPVAAAMDSQHADQVLGYALKAAFGSTPSPSGPPLGTIAKKEEPDNGVKIEPARGGVLNVVSLATSDEEE